MTEPIGELSPDLASLLRSAQHCPALSRRSLDRMERRLGLAVVVAAGVGGILAPAFAGPFFAKLVLYFSSKLRLALVSLALGAGMGATGHALVARSTMQRVTDTAIASVRVSSSASAVAAVLGPPVTSGAPSVPATPPSTEPVPTAQSTAGVRSDLAAERALLEMGRTALARGDREAALDATRRHLNSFRHGRLTEERELIAIQALSGLGRREEARERGARFLQAYPRSMFAAAVRAAAPPDP